MKKVKIKQIKSGIDRPARQKRTLVALGIKKMSEIGVTMSASIPIKPDPKKDFTSEFNRRFYERLQAHEVPLAYARV